MRNLKKDEIEMTERREAMLAEGFRLFAERGIEAVVMQEVAEACHLGIATLYRYYKTKLDLVLAIGTRQWRDYIEYVRQKQEERNSSAMTAAQELEFYLDFYLDLYQNHKDLLSFHQSFNHYLAHEKPTPEQLRPYLEALDEMGRFLHVIYEKGRRDGTIRTDMPEEKLFATTGHIMMAVGVRYAQSLIFFAGEGEKDRMEEYQLLKKMILREYLTA